MVPWSFWEEASSRKATAKRSVGALGPDSCLTGDAWLERYTSKVYSILAHRNIPSIGLLSSARYVRGLVYFITRKMGEITLEGQRRLRGTSFQLLGELRGHEPLKPKRTLRLRTSFFPPRSSRVVQFQNLVWRRFPSVSRASGLKSETVYEFTLAVASILLPCHSASPRTVP
jgi:hypothetical protein